MKLGFVGTGAITESVVRGLVKAGIDLEVIAVSPRNAEVAARLAALHHRIRIARDNQSVVDSTDVVFLAVRLQVARDVVAGLEFHPGQRVVSFVAGLQLEELAEWTRGTPRLCRAIPVPLVAELHGVTATFPGDSVVTELFSSLGLVVEARDAAEFELFGAACCLMGTYFGFLDVIARWMMAKGRRHWPGSATVWNTFAPSHQGHADLPPHGEPARCSAPARPHEDRKHGPVSWD